MTDATFGALAGGGIQKVLELARRHLDMDLAFVAEFTGGRQVYRGLAGDAASFGWQLDDGPPLSETYCRLMTEGEIPQAIADASAHPLVRGLAVTADAGLGSYVGVPVHLTDGSLYGSLCAVSHTPQQVDDKDAKFLRMLAELVAAEAEAERTRAASRARIRELIHSGSVVIALQPIVSLGTGRVLGTEALSRFPGDHGPPNVVFAAAHAAGAGTELERLAAARAFETLGLLGSEAYLAINLTPAVAIELASIAVQTPDLPLDRLVLEITEHSAVDNYQVLRGSLGPARERGLRLAIDDAGAGYASLHHIVELHPDLIKIDRSLIDGNAHDPARRSVIRAFVGLAADLDAHVVGEGVETRADLESARDLGVDAAQGYLLARPSTDRGDLRRWLGAGFDV